MKVGFYLSSRFPQIGGTYGCERNLCDAIVKHAGESRHEFAFMGWSMEGDENFTAKSVQWLSMRRNLKERLNSKLEGLGRKVLGRTKNDSSSLESWMTGFLLDQGLEFMIYPNLMAIPTRDVPYATVVLDVQHRLQPYFPEVSQENAWQTREDNYRSGLQRATWVFVGTQRGREDLLRFYQVAPERIRLLPHHVPSFALEAIPGEGAEVVKKYSLPEKYLFYPAQFWPHKNHVTLLNALAWLRDHEKLVCPVVLTGADKGNERHVRGLVRELKLEKQVHFAGFVPLEDLVEFYRKALALVFLTFFGPDNLPPLEAFALRCPVIASDVPGAREQLGDGAHLVDPHDFRSVAAGIQRIHEDAPFRETLIQRGLSRITGLSEEQTARDLFSALDDFESIRRCWSSREPYNLQ